MAYLLLSGKLPDKEELSAFKELLNDNMPLEQKDQDEYSGSGRTEHHEYIGS